jgi:hypothetical protein
MACFDKSVANACQAFCVSHEKRTIVFKVVCESVQDLDLGISFKVDGNVAKENAIEHAGNWPFPGQIELFEMHHVSNICPDFYPAMF